MVAAFTYNRQAHLLLKSYNGICTSCECLFLPFGPRLPSCTSPQQTWKPADCCPQYTMYLPLPLDVTTGPCTNTKSIFYAPSPSMPHRTCP